LNGFLELGDRTGPCFIHCTYQAGISVLPGRMHQ
jgi:hypothetical protein